MRLKDLGGVGRYFTNPDLLKGADRTMLEHQTDRYRTSLGIEHDTAGKIIYLDLNSRNCRDIASAHDLDPKIIQNTYMALMEYKIETGEDTKIYFKKDKNDPNGTLYIFIIHHPRIV